MELENYDDFDNVLDDNAVTPTKINKFEDYFEEDTGFTCDNEEDLGTYDNP